MHPRSSYLAAAGEEDSNQEPLLAHEDYPVLLPDAEPSASASTTPSKEPEESVGKGKDSDQKANPSPTSVTPEKAEGYGLPTGYQAQYARENWQMTLLLSTDSGCPCIASCLTKNPWRAEGPPDTQAMQSDNQVNRQPALPPVPIQNHRMQMLGSFDDAPAVVTCANCGVTGHTFVYKVRVMDTARSQAM